MSFIILYTSSIFLALEHISHQGKGSKGNCSDSSEFRIGLYRFVSYALASGFQGKLYRSPIYLTLNIYYCKVQNPSVVNVRGLEFLYTARPSSCLVFQYMHTFRL